MAVRDRPIAGTQGSAVSVIRRGWQRDESLLVLRLYCHTPFGKLHARNPEIMQLAEIIGRTAAAVAMKAVNFAHLDPSLDRKGLSSVSKADRELWENFLADSNAVALLAESLFSELVLPRVRSEVHEPKLPAGPTEAMLEVSVRRVQGFFRRSLLTSYGRKCAASGLRLPSLLVASHIIPWKDSVERRADPRNGILLNSLYDQAFDRGLITFDEGWRVVLSRELKERLSDGDLSRRMLDIEGRPLQMPNRFLPDESAMEFHRERVFEF